MGYLDKAKRVATTYENEPEDIGTAKEANDAQNASKTVLTPLEELRNKSLAPSVPETCSAPIQGVAIPTRPDTIPRLPWQLEALLRAANSDVLPKGLQQVQGQGQVPDLSTYALACATSYLIGDRDAALERLWRVYRTWKETN